MDIGSGTDDYSADYDAANNVTSVATTLSVGTDSQTFNYDSLEALNWFTNEPHGSYRYGTLE